jgi:exodeoxyribonuclease V beta subunit
LPSGVGEPYQPLAGVAPQLAARSFTRSHFEHWRVGSFTALTAAGHATDLAEWPDYDLSVAAPVADAGPVTSPLIQRDRFSFPRGARSGTCLHAIFERLDFSRGEREPLAKLVRRTLTGHGLDAEAWTPTVAEWMEQTLATPLDESGLHLAMVTPERRINELEFYYPLAQLRVETLRQVLAQHGYAVGPFREMLDRLQFSPVRGYMKGFIDLVFEADGRFYLVDYKSNWLGAEWAAYRREGLAEVMARESYVLQYLIYTVAVHRYLRLRVADYSYAQHFGGVYYLFLRGMDPALGSAGGVFHDRPAPELVMALDALMAGAKN